MELMVNCHVIPGFHSCIFVDSKENRDSVFELLIDTVKLYKSEITCTRYSKLEGRIDFSNGSFIYVRTINNGSRRRYHKILCDSSVKDTDWFNQIAHSYIMPYYFMDAVELIDLDGGYERSNQNF